MQYKVPQNIDLEDKIVGPFTMRQFLYLLVGGFILYGWWNYSNQYVSPPPMIIFLIIGLPVGLLAICLALVKINDRPFEYFLLNLVKFIFSPKQRRWTTGFKIEATITMDPIEAKKKEQEVRTESDLDSLALTLEQHKAKLTSKNPVAARTGTAKPSNINLSVKDVDSASKKQQTAQAKPPQKGGILGFFK